MIKAWNDEEENGRGFLRVRPFFFFLADILCKAFWLGNTDCVPRFSGVELQVRVVHVGAVRYLACRLAVIIIYVQMTQLWEPNVSHVSDKERVFK
jgi:hypothetical protein